MPRVRTREGDLGGLFAQAQADADFRRNFMQFEADALQANSRFACSRVLGKLHDADALVVDVDAHLHEEHSLDVPHNLSGVALVVTEDVQLRNLALVV